MYWNSVTYLEVLITDVEKRLQNLNKLSKYYSEKKPDDASLKESFDKNQSQWNSTLSNINRLRNQLDQVPEKWSKYREQYQDMTKWMDKVDHNIKNLFKNAKTFEDFEKEKVTFQVRK